MTLMLTNISLINTSSVQAAEVDNTVTANDSTTKISLENIRDIVIENNLDLKIKDNELKIAKETRDDAKDAFESKTKPTEAEYTNTNSDGTVVFDSVAYKAAVTAYDSAKSAYEKAKDAHKTAKTNYDQKVESAVYDAQNSYLTYLADVSAEKINGDTVNYNDKKAQVYKIQYESGFISKNEYTSKLQGNTSVNDSNKSKDTKELDRIKLCNLLGISPDEKVTFNTDITVDFQVILKINYEEDLKQMLDNSLDIKTKSDNADDLNDEDDDSDSHDYQVDNAAIELKQAINTAETDFKGKYNDLIASYNSVKSSYDKITQEQKDFEVTKVQYDYGFISKNALDNSQITLDKDSASFIKARNDCYLKYLNYIEMKEGY